MKKIVFYIKKALSWYMKQYLAVYGPIIKAGLNPCL